MTNESDQSSIADCVLQLPTGLIETEQVFDLGRHHVKVFSTPKAHTEGDLVVWSSTEKILATGDLFMRDSAPSTDGGNMQNLALVLVDLLKLGAQKIVPGHFAISENKHMDRFREYISAQLEYADQAVSEGISLEDAISNADFSEFRKFAEYPQYEATFKDNVRAAYLQRVDQITKPE